MAPLAMDPGADDLGAGVEGGWDPYGLDRHSTPSPSVIPMICRSHDRSRGRDPPPHWHVRPLGRDDVACERDIGATSARG